MEVRSNSDSFWKILMFFCRNWSETGQKLSRFRPSICLYITQSCLVKIYLVNKQYRTSWAHIINIKEKIKTQFVIWDDQMQDQGFLWELTSLGISQSRRPGAVPASAVLSTEFLSHHLKAKECFCYFSAYWRCILKGETN